VSEVYPHQPEDEELLQMMGRLMLELQARAERMGMCEYIDVSPQDASNPGEGYHWDYWICKKRD